MNRGGEDNQMGGIREGGIDFLDEGREEKEDRTKKKNLRRKKK